MPECWGLNGLGYYFLRYFIILLVLGRGLFDARMLGLNSMKKKKK